MANTIYTPTTWTNESPNTSPVKYQVIDDTHGHIADSATIAPVTTITPGTPLNAVNLNKLETGLQTTSKQSVRPISMPGAAKTIVSGAITLTPSVGEGFYTVDTTGGSTQFDTLSTINGGSDGDIIHLLQTNSSRIILLSSAGNIQMPPNFPTLCLSPVSPLELRYSAAASKWMLVYFSDPYLELWKNNSGGTVTNGDVAVFDKSGITYFTTTAIQGDKRILGVVVTDGSTIANGAWGWIAKGGRRTVNLNAAVTVGQALITSTVAKKAIPNGGASQDGYIGWVVDATNSPTSCVAEINPKTDRTGGQVTLVSSGAFTSTNGSASTNVTVSGNNRLLVVIGIDQYGSSDPFGTPTYGAAGFTATTVNHSANNTNLLIGFLLAPAVGTALLALNTAPSTYTSCYWILFNDVNQSTPCTLATPADDGSTTTPSLAMSVTPGDFIVGVLEMYSASITVSGRGASQTSLYDNIYQSNHLVIDTTLTANNSTQTDSWTVSSATNCLVHMITIHPL